MTKRDELHSGGVKCSVDGCGQDAVFLVKGTTWRIGHMATDDREALATMVQFASFGVVSLRNWAHSLIHVYHAQQERIVALEATVERIEILEAAG